MYELSRRVRITLNPSQLGPGGPLAAEPSGRALDAIGVGAFYELEVTCRGEPEPRTGFVMNISEIDAAVRGQAVPMIEEAMRRWMTGARQSAGVVLAEILGALQPRLGHAVASVRWWLSPSHWLLVETTNMDRVLISQQFE
ncbi:MAG: hypothetical protein ACYTGF_17395, partial [Planctomycetota bacterium]